jgi:hypothetical protein
MFITNSYGCHDVVNRHSTLLAVAVEVATLSDEMLLSVSEQDVIGAVEGLADRLFCAFVELAGLMWSFKTKRESNFINNGSRREECSVNLHFLFCAIQMLEELQSFSESVFRSLGGSISLDAFELLHASSQLNLSLKETLVSAENGFVFEMVERAERWNIKY